MRRIFSFIAKLAECADRWWYFPAIAFLAGIDLFIGIIPTDGLVISSVLLRPKNWISAAVWPTLGSALGAFLMAWLLGSYGQAALDTLLGSDTQSTTWLEAERLLQEYGVLAVGLIAISPFPQQPIVAAAGLAQVSPFAIALSVLLGRGAKYGLFAWVTTHAPEVFRKWGIGMKLYDQAQGLIREHRLHKRQQVTSKTKEKKR